MSEKSSRNPRTWAMALAAALIAGGISFATLFWWNAQTKRDEPVQEWTTQGTIQSLDPDREYATIAHERIEGFMEAMTMPFNFGEPQQASGLKPGDAVRFSFSVGPQGRVMITSIERIED